MENNINLHKIDELIKTHLSSLFNNQKLVSVLPSNNVLREIVEKNFDIMAATENKLGIEGKPFLEEKLAKFAEITKIHYIVKKYDLADETDTIDEINWLVTYVRNQYNIDLLVTADDQVINNEPNLNSPDPETKDFATIEEQEKFNEFFGTPEQAVNYQQKKYIAITTVYKKIYTGELFIFKSKPKIVPILLKIFWIVFLIESVVFITGIILSIIYNISYSTSAIAGGVPPMIVVALAVGIFMVSWFQSWYKYYYKNKNDNFKYGYQFKSFGPIGGYTAFSLLTVLFIVFFGPEVSGVKNLYEYAVLVVATSEGDSMQNGLIIAIAVFYSAVLFFILLIVVLSVLLHNFVPKLDNQKINDEIKRLVENTPADSEPTVSL